ncbi:SDR family oxidoreductase [Mycobacterium sp. B14F4]|uniref:SDR family NAD(P)-dependent oxidoreductase n=1 Tax=Mycobacterium sp. B14F4 TaxID=3153565 RepID=UPI00325D1FD1
MAIDPSDILLTDRVAVVTGGGAGIGKGVAAGLAAFGASVAIWERDAETCRSTAEGIGRIAGSAGGGALGLTLDVCDSAQVDAALERTVAELGEVSILVNNAGGVFNSPLLETTENGWDALYKANLRHVLLCTQRIARRLVAAKQPGSVINVTSIEGVRAAPGYAAYAAAKAGVVNYTQTAAFELAPHDIRVNAIAPDLTLTEGLMKLSGGTLRPDVAPGIPMGRPGHVDEIASTAVFLASKMSSYITGQTIHVDGGTQAAGGWYHHPQTGRPTLGPPAQ